MMDSVKHPAVTQNKSRLSRTFAKVLNIKAPTGIAPDDGIQKNKSHQKKKKDQVKNMQIPSFDNEDEVIRETAIREAFLAKLFADISAIKAAYAQLQYFQSPYDPDGIQSADQIIVSELKNLSELKHSYLKQQLNESSPQSTLLLSEIQEQKSLLQTYEITSRKLDSQLKLKNSEITFLKEKLAEVNRDNKCIEKRLNSSGQIYMPENTCLSTLKPSHFIAYFHHAVKSIRSFVRLLISEMESASWDLDSAAISIQPGISFWKPNHKCHAFESYVCKIMFDAFNQSYFSSRPEAMADPKTVRSLSFDMFVELKSVRPADYLARKPNSIFATFCRTKYLKLVHSKMEESLFGSLDTRNSVKLGEYPETLFFLAFGEMAKCVWLLHCLALSFEPKVSIFQVEKGTCFSEVYMESLSDEAFLSTDADDGTQGTEPRVAFTVIPGFKVGQTIVQCQVYLF